MKYFALLALQVAGVILLAYFIVASFGTSAIMLGDSMNPGIYNEDHLLVNRLSYVFSHPSADDVIVFRPSGNLNAQYSVKRVVAEPGDSVYITGGKLYVNGEEYDDVYDTDAMTDGGLAETEFTLSEGEYFVLGDNRNNSEDSRYQTIGNVSEDDIVGRAWLNVTFGNFGFVK